jgi:beta-N-acetylhexosaminidase
MGRVKPGSALLAALLAAAACGSGCGGSSPIAPTSAPPSSQTSPAAPTPPSTTAPTPSATCADRVLEGMSEPQRIGQLFLLGLAGDRLGPAEIGAIRDDHFGSVWFVDKSSAGVSSIRGVSDAVQAQATRRNTSSVRFYVAANQEGGVIQSLAGPGFSTIPSALQQGALAPSTLRADARTWGNELTAAGVNFNFAPVMDVVPPGTDAQNQPIGALQREYGREPQTAGGHGVAFLRGMKQAGVTTSAKHFPGLGRVQGNTDFAANVVDRVTTEDDPYLQSFAEAVDAGVPFVMVALATYRRIDPAHLAVFSPTVIGQMLRRDLHFDGVVLSDDLAATSAVASIPPRQRAVDFLEAGGDMVIAKTLEPALDMYAGVLDRTTGDAGFRAVVDEAALRVLAAKQVSGLLPCSTE